MFHSLSGNASMKMNELPIYQGREECAKLKTVITSELEQAHNIMRIPIIETKKENESDH